MGGKRGGEGLRNCASSLFPSFASPLGPRAHTKEKQKGGFNITYICPFRIDLTSLGPTCNGAQGEQR